MARVPRFERVAGADRRRMLAEAAIASIMEGGAEGASIRRIAAKAGVSVGLIHHHFGSIDELVAQAYELLYDRIIAGVEAGLAAAGPAPRERLSALFRASFSPALLMPELLTAWVVFWSMIRHSAPMRQAHEAKYAAYSGILEGLLAAHAAAAGLPGFDLRLAAIGLSSLLDGLWLEWCLNPASFSPAVGIARCEAWVAGLPGAVGRLG